MRRILLIALAVARAQNGVLLIDEIETAIHVSVLGRVFRWLLESRRRLWA
jgi:AAA15 family ATPase/GTPase